MRRARGGEKLTTLDDVERTLHPDDLLITDGGEQPLAIAGVMGGASSEVSRHDDRTSSSRRRTSTRRRSPGRRAGTVSSPRPPSASSAGSTRSVTAAAAQLAVDLLVEHGGGTVDAGVTDVDRTAERTAYLLDVTEPARIVGVDYPRERVVGILRDLGCKVEETGEGADGTHVLVTPPSWRPDLVDAPDSSRRSRGSTATTTSRRSRRRRATVAA